MTSVVGLGCGRVDDESLELRLLRGRQLREHALHLLTETQEEQHRWKQKQQENNVRNKFAALTGWPGQAQRASDAMRVCCACAACVTDGACCVSALQNAMMSLWMAVSTSGFPNTCEKMAMTLPVWGVTSALCVRYRFMSVG